jgi:hypothetical protein
MSGVFHNRAPGWQALNATAKPFRDRYGAAFGSAAETNQFFRNMMVPACGSWVFCPNGKTGSTSVLQFLFHLMFGAPLSTRVLIRAEAQTEGDTAHQLVESRVFAWLALMGDGHDPLAVFDAALRLTTVRDPFTRAVSGFLYLCRSQEMMSPRFLDVRQRLCAMQRFDWDSHPGTHDGFLRFLDHVEAELAHHDTLPVDSHFRPQVLNVRPGIVRPHLTGRCEDLPSFFTAIAARLERPLPEGLDLDARHNRQPDDGRDIFDTPASRARVAQIFAADHEAFGYDP